MVEQYKFITRQQLADYIDIETIPERLGGKRVTKTQILESDTPYYQHDIRFKIGDKAMGSFLKYHKQVVKNLQEQSHTIE